MTQPITIADIRKNLSTLEQRNKNVLAAAAARIKSRKKVAQAALAMRLALDAGTLLLALREGLDFLDVAEGTKKLPELTFEDELSKYTGEPTPNLLLVAGYEAFGGNDGVKSLMPDYLPRVYPWAVYCLEIAEKKLNGQAMRSVNERPALVARALDIYDQTVANSSKLVASLHASGARGMNQAQGVYLSLLGDARNLSRACSYVTLPADVKDECLRAYSAAQLERLCEVHTPIMSKKVYPRYLEIIVPVASAILGECGRVLDLK